MNTAINSNLNCTIVGCGAIGSAFLEGHVRAESALALTIYDRNRDKLAKLSQLSRHYRPSVTLEEGVRQAECVIMAIKPHTLIDTLRDLRQILQPHAIIISLAAGITLDELRGALLPTQTVVRAMPNLPIAVGRGIVGVYAGEEPMPPCVEALFSPVGEVLFCKREEELTILTSLASGGPAFLALVVEALADAGVKLGLSREFSLIAARHTIAGTGEYMRVHNIHPALFQELVSSPSGTTIRGLHVLENQGVKGAFMAAVEASFLRAVELAGRDGGSSSGTLTPTGEVGE